MSNIEAEEMHLMEMALPTSTSQENLANDFTSIITIFDLCWDDILIPKVLSHLSLKELFTLRTCSQSAKRLVEAALARRKEINLSGNNSHMINLAFSVLSTCCKHLENLYLAHCRWLTDELLLPMLAENKQLLKVINLNECPCISPMALQPIIVDCKNLRVLKLSKCHWLTSGAIDALTLHQNNLQEIDISHCPAIGERCLLIFFRKLNKLTILSLANTAITDQVLVIISNCCRLLEHINLIGCTAISDYGIIAISTRCTRLRTLLVLCCPRVTENSLGPLRKHIYIDKTNQSEPYLNINDFYPSDFLIY
uniref:F-box/LRR-repeat protein 15-like leucin rich repeat domain-containing protein n=1 Tax=Glossina brevipalpis TaxID=37001 RepID=A0A1A9WKN1_9MUSC